LVPAVPAYFDDLIDAYLRGHAGRNVHLGFWDDPPALTTPCAPGEFEAAQARLTEILVEMAAMTDGLDVLDVGCGFGGTLEAVGAWSNLSRTGVNIDPRQLEICASMAKGDGALTFVAADACALPFSSGSFDRVFCVEAMFHFRSRRSFLQEAARVLRCGGRLVVSDILLRKPNAGPIAAERIVATIQREYGPWPHPWIDESEFLAVAKECGLTLVGEMDATQQTLPSYRVTAPQSRGRLAAPASAGQWLRWLHENGCARYACLAFVRS
jgi:MPBQ/MSBQ methyltransferase